MPQPSPTLMELDVNLIEPDPDQPRKHFDREAIDSLAASMRGQGQLIPILTWHDQDKGVYRLIDGERRWRAAQGRLATLKAEVLPFKPTPEEALLMMVSIDQQREALDPVEQAIAYQRLIAANQWSPTALAKAIHVSLSTITRSLDLLDLPESLQGLVKSRALPVNIGRELARLAGNPSLIDIAWAKVRDEKLGQAATAKLVSGLLKAAVNGKTRGPKPAKKWAFKNVGGYSATVSAKAVRLVSLKKGSTTQDVLTALRQLVERFEAEVARTEAKSEGRTQDVPAAEPVLPG